MRHLTNQRVVTTFLALAFWTLALCASAQQPAPGTWAPPGGAPAGQPPPQQYPQQQPYPQQPYPAQPTYAPPPAQQAPQQTVEANAASEEASEPEATNTSSDHEMWAGHLAVTYFGIPEVPVQATADSSGQVTGYSGVAAPTVGIRYWINKMIGLDIGLGIGIQTGSRVIDSPGARSDDSTNSRVGLLLHGGLPIALYYKQHYSFLLIPEVNVGVGGGVNYGPNPDGSQDEDLSSFLIDIGGRVGSEIHFGFIDIPQLSLQATVGLNFRFLSASTTTGPSNGEVDTTFNSISLGTTLQNSPWDIFRASVAALYYF